jgi:hypothetical protein
MDDKIKVQDNISVISQYQKPFKGETVFNLLTNILLDRNMDLMQLCLEGCEIIDSGIAIIA